MKLLSDLAIYSIFTGIIFAVLIKLTDTPPQTGKVKRPTVLSSVSYVHGVYRERRQYFDGVQDCEVARKRVEAEIADVNIVAICSRVRVA